MPILVQIKNICYQQNIASVILSERQLEKSENNKKDKLWTSVRNKYGKILGTVITLGDFAGDEKEAEDQTELISRMQCS